MGRRHAASQQRPGLRALPLLAAIVSLGLSGCASISEKFADTASQAPQIGLPASAPSRPEQQMTYPAVHDVPPPRTAVVLTDVEQQKLETDLLAVGNQQRAAAGVKLSNPQDNKPAAKNTGKNKADKNQRAASQANQNQANQNQANQDQASAPAPISASSSRTIY
jgi:hypothetical protein